MFSKTELRRTLHRRSFFDFFCHYWKVLSQEKLVVNWHIPYLCNELQAAAFRVFRGEPNPYDYIINIPPGTSKSTIISQMFPAWVWTYMPYAQFICASYTRDVALKDATRMRDILTSSDYRAAHPEVEIRGDVDAKGMFQNTLGGWRLSTGAAGSITSFHAHFLLTDDPLSPLEALSDADRLAANNFQEHTLPSRKVNKEVSTTILVMQRLHEDDPSGRLLSKKSARIRHICLPGEITADLRPKRLSENYVDGLLDPVRLSKSVLDAMREQMGPYAYAGQILQSPVPADGGVFDVRRIDRTNSVPPPMVRKARAWDKAGSKGAGDYTAGVLLGVDGQKRFWILDIVRGRWSAWERENIIKATAEKDGKETEIVVEQEGGSGGKESAESTVRNLAGFRVTVVKPTGDKQARAYGFASQVGGSNVSCLDRDWTGPFLQELGVFPNGLHDDQVDAATAAFNRISIKKTRIGAL